MELGIEYLTDFFDQFLRKGDLVLICFPDEGPDSLGYRLYCAAEAAGARPRFWGSDRRWIALLRLAFDCRAGCIVAPPLLVLGLTKLARATGTPLYLRNVVTAEWACPQWLKNGIMGGLDCRIYCLERDLPVQTQEQRRLADLADQINPWTSILDCRLNRGPAGLEIELVVFPGEKLPSLPSCAKLIVRPWDPATDEPFYQDSLLKIPQEPTESH